MNPIHWLFFFGTIVVSLGFTLYGQWVFWKYSMPDYRTSVTGCEIARYVLDHRGFFHISVTPLEPPDDSSSPEGFSLDPKIYEGQDFLSILRAARQAFLKSQFSNMTFWIRLKKRMTFLVGITSLAGWLLILPGIFFRPLGFLTSMGLGCFAVVMILAILDLPFELEVEEKTSGFLKHYEHFQPNEFMCLKKLNQAIAFWGLSNIMRAPWAVGVYLFRKGDKAYEF